MNTKKTILAHLLFLSTLTAFGGTYQTQVIGKGIHTLRIRTDRDNNFIRPILRLGSEEVLEFSFDELSHDIHYYSYTVYHCNADGTPSNLNSSEYLKGFTTLDITDAEQSVNTTQPYTHYRFTLPNEDMQLTLSGNYAVCVYEDGDKDHPVAWACFSIVEPLATIQTTIRSQTDIELNGRYQQIDIDIIPNQSINDPRTELKLLVRQNGRTDNQVFGIPPTFIEPNRFRYINNRALIFEGGNEYRSFDISSLYIMGDGVERINYDHTYYHVLLTPSENNSDHAYVSKQDVNGQYAINLENSDYDDTEADYLWVHFYLPTPSPFFDGQLYIGGDFNLNTLDIDNRMQYDAQNEGYIYSKLLKQGGYNYQYWFVPKNEKKATGFRTEGSHWQTENEYTVFLYYRPFGQRYDSLIGYQSISSNR